MGVWAPQETIARQVVSSDDSEGVVRHGGEERANGLCVRKRVATRGGARSRCKLQRMVARGREQSQAKRSSPNENDADAELPVRLTVGGYM